MEEFRNNAYENVPIYKEKTKQWHDKHIVNKEFKESDKVLLFNSRLRLFPGKLRSRWSSLFIIHRVFPHGVIELHHPMKGTIKVNGQRLKPYIENGNEDEGVSILLQNRYWHNTLREQSGSVELRHHHARRGDTNNRCSEH
ncbi:uncharacterized protein LOC116139842 [Pistacia vera]|uniref:uncharacterized protein LOC116139842 n=1 Tax=Pistacia vera TaxID=55513 RepID=UPI001262EA77|nr:uncharacterized protein LOC116139842 [Pistacia vera]